ncbi:MAG: YdeI/OmpD-associated family protein [Oscillospiraceae bacterium]|nr:YdeI/OmpD-associated family protein [Oscillospiraceae bacterium]
MTFTFKGEIKRLEGKIRWSVIYFPHPAAPQFGEKGNIPVCITVDGHPFDHMLLPSKNGHYLVYNEFIKRAVGKSIGDVVEVTLEKDTKPRIFTAPAQVEEALKAAGVWETFSAQPDYLKREQMNRIELAKKEETKTARLNTLIKLMTGAHKQ